MPDPTQKRRRIGLAVMDVPRPSESENRMWQHCLAAADHFDFEFIEEVIPSGTSDSLVRGSTDLSSACAGVAQRLVDRGASLIIGECGFTIRYKAAMESVVDVPIAVSSLQLLPLLRILKKPQSKLGILTFEEDQLSADVLSLADPSYNAGDLVVEDLHGSETWRLTYEADESGQDERTYEMVRRDVFAAARRLKDKSNSIQFVLLECSLMFPFAKQLQEDLKRPVFHLQHLTNMLMSSMSSQEDQAAMLASAFE